LYWKGPAPWYFITVPEEECSDLQATSAFVSYGWGMIPVTVQIGATEWTTSLFPKDALPRAPEGERAKGRTDWRRRDRRGTSDHPFLT
jgi:hypothetical protein